MKGNLLKICVLFLSLFIIATYWVLIHCRSVHTASSCVGWTLYLLSQALCWFSWKFKSYPIVWLITFLCIFYYVLTIWAFEVIGTRKRSSVCKFLCCRFSHHDGIFDSFCAAIWYNGIYDFAGLLSLIWLTAWIDAFLNQVDKKCAKAESPSFCSWKPALSSMFGECNQLFNFDK